MRTNLYLQNRKNAWKADNDLSLYSDFESYFFDNFEYNLITNEFGDNGMKSFVRATANMYFKKIGETLCGVKEEYKNLVDEYADKIYVQAINMPINKDNFFKMPQTIFKRVSDLEDQPDFTSVSGSTYYYKNGGVVRGADHWGELSSVKWNIDKEDSGYIYGFSRWSDFSWRP